MSSKFLWCGVLVIALSAALATPANADNLKTISDESRIAIVAVAAVIVVVVTVVAIHYSKKRTVTGCVSSTGNRMTVTDEKDLRVYALAGNTVGIKPGDRMKVQGKRIKPNGSDKASVLEARRVVGDFGACQR